MSRGLHIIGVEIPDASAAAIMALEAGRLSEAVAGLDDQVDVRVAFGDGSVYEYPAVPGSIALALKFDPEGVFPTVKFWPGYRRVR